MLLQLLRLMALACEKGRALSEAESTPPRCQSVRGHGTLTKVDHLRKLIYGADPPCVWALAVNSWLAASVEGLSLGRDQGAVRAGSGKEVSSTQETIRNNGRGLRQLCRLGNRILHWLSSEVIIEKVSSNLDFRAREIQ